MSKCFCNNRSELLPNLFSGVRRLGVLLQRRNNTVLNQRLVDDVGVQDRGT